MKSDGLFHFKKFSVRHLSSSMKVGVDGVLIGLWASPCGGRILDIGTGCGVISLILAQRNPEAEIRAIDIDVPSVEECRENFESSPWSDRLEVSQSVFPDNEICGDRQYDMIISNPPFFDSGVSEPDSPRMTARHVGLISPELILKHSACILRRGGVVSMIFPTEHLKDVREKALGYGYRFSKGVFVRNHPTAKVKRVMTEFTYTGFDGYAVESLGEDLPMMTLFDERREPTEDYLKLGKDFYLKF